MEWNVVQYHTTVSSGSVTWLDKLHILIYSWFCWDTTNLEQLAILLLKCKWLNITLWIMELFTLTIVLYINMAMITTLYWYYAQLDCVILLITLISSIHKTKH